MAAIAKHVSYSVGTARQFYPQHQDKENSINTRQNIMYFLSLNTDEEGGGRGEGEVREGNPGEEVIQGRRRTSKEWKLVLKTEY